MKKALNKEGEEGGADLKSVRPKKKAPAATEEGHEEGGAKSARAKSKLKAPTGEEGEE